MTVDKEAAAVRILCGFGRTLLVLLLGLPSLTVDSLDSLTVVMAGKNQTVLLNHTATIFCMVLGSSHLNIERMGVTWYRKNPVTGTDDVIFGFHANYQKAFRSGANVSLQGLAKGNASLQLPRVQLKEAGEYRCKVVNTPDKGQGTVFVEVVACPVIFVEDAKVRDNDDQRLLCQASGFYPKDINITWYKWNKENSQYLEISEGITTDSAIENEDKTFNVTSSLRLKHSLEHNVNYLCMVKHICSSTPWRGNITLPENGSEPKSGSWTLVWIMLSVCLGVPVLIAAISLWRRYHCYKWTLNKDTY